MIEISTEYGPATIDHKTLADGLRRYRKDHEPYEINNDQDKAEKRLSDTINKLKK